MESIESKLKVIEDSLNKRNEKYSNLVKEQQYLSKTMDYNEKSRTECEKKIQENEAKLKKRLDDLSKCNNIN